MRRATLFTTAALLLGLASGPAAAQSAPFSSMVVFGDSLSDSGDLALSLGLPRLRFTTNPGLVAVEDIAQHYGLTLSPSFSGGTDYAYGGAGLIFDSPSVPFAPKVPAQVASYLGANPHVDPNTLFALWGGPNDIFFHQAALRAGTETLDQALANTAAAAQLEASLVAPLQAAGARRIIVFNLPNIAATPGGEPAEQVLSTTFNAVLNQQLAGRRGVVPVNVFALFNEVVAHPAAYGFSNVNTPACTVSTSLVCSPQTLVQPNAGSTFLFADDVHPTVAAHAALAQAVISELDAPGQMSLLAEAPLALLRGHRAAVAEALDADPAGQGLTLFATARAGAARLSGDWAVPTSHGDLSAVTMGGVWRSGGPLTVGAALTLGKDRVSLAGELGGFDAKQLAVSAFGRWDWTGGSWAGLQVGVGHTDYDDIRRSFAIGAAFVTERSSSKGRELSAEAAGGHWFQAGGLRTGPFLSFTYDRVRIGDVVEPGGDATSMWFLGQTREAAVARVGWSLRGAASLAGLAVEPLASIAYAHDFRADRRAVTAGLTTMSGDFSMPAYQPSSSWGEATLGLSAELAHGVRGQVSYEGLFGDRGHENLGLVGVSVSF